MSLEFQLLLGLFFILGGVLGVVLMVMPLASRSRGSGFPGILTVGKHKYPYELGDQILRYGGHASFSGIDVLIPKRMPHIFLDAYGNNDGMRAEFVFENDNKIKLEGDFNRTFQAYAPKQHRALVLSILTPDVMETLMKHAHRFDVEIMEHHVRLIAPNQLVSRNEQTQEELLAAAKAVMKEVDHRLKSWKESSLTGDTSLDVRKYNMHR